ncbi:MAG: hypothetical protein GX547_16385 [Phycisphaerae bacterium]|nr:hypothetical protein [Phycisphaerae bacterium]
MSNVIHDTVMHGSSAVNLARVADYDDALATPAAIAAISYTIERESADAAFSAVDGHANQPVDVAACLFAEMQNDSRWTCDSVGYNFRHLVPIDLADAFPTPGVYWVRYRFVPAAGQPFVIAFRLRAL